jgi:hypothetical protein
MRKEAQHAERFSSTQELATFRRYRGNILAGIVDSKWLAILRIYASRTTDADRH